MSARALTLLAALCVSAATAQGEDPRLFTVDATALRAKLEREPFKARWAAFRAKLELAPGHPNPTFTNLASVRWLVFTAVNHCFAYRVTGDARHAEAAHALLKPALAWKRWHRDWDWNKGAELPTAALAYASGVFLDTCGATLSAAERRRVIERVDALAITPYLASIDEHKDWWVKEPHSNWTGTVHGQIGMLGLALRGTPRGDRVARLAHEHLTRFLKSATLADGGSYEGVMYGRAGLEPACQFLHAWRNCHEPDAALPVVPKLARERLLGYWDAYLHGPDQVYANFNDMNAQTFAGLFGTAPRKRGFGGPNANLAALFEAQWPEGDPLLLWAADMGGGGDFSRGIAPWWFLWRRPAPPLQRERPALKPAVLFRGAGHAVLRSKRLWLALQGGWIPDSAIHKNHDLGSFVLVADGARAVHDPGYGKRAPHDHSHLTLAGPEGKPLEQRKGARGLYRALFHAEGVRYAAVELTAAYPQGDGRHEVEHWVRHTLLLGERVAVIVDELDPGRDSVFKTRLQVPVEPTLRGTSRARLALKDGVGVTVDAIGGTLHVEPSHPFALVTHPSGTVGPPRLMVTVLTVGKARAPKWKQANGSATLTTAEGKLTLKRESDGWYATRFGKTAIERGDPSERSVKR